MSARGLLLTLILGSIGGLLCDQIHVQFGVLWYAEPDLLGQPWWVGPQFGLALIVILLGSKPLAKRSQAPMPELLSIAGGFAVFIAAYLATGILKDQPLLLSAILLASWLVRILKRPDRWVAIGHALLLALGGVAYESALSSTGVFSYASPDLGWVPVWLPLLYAHGAPVALDVTRRQ